MCHQNAKEKKKERKGKKNVTENIYKTSVTLK